MMTAQVVQMADELEAEAKQQAQQSASQDGGGAAAATRAACSSACVQDAHTRPPCTHRPVPWTRRMRAGSSAAERGWCVCAAAGAGAPAAAGPSGSGSGAAQAAPVSVEEQQHRATMVGWGSHQDAGQTQRCMADVSGASNRAWAKAQAWACQWHASSHHPATRRPLPGDDALPASMDWVQATVSRKLLSALQRLKAAKATLEPKPSISRAVAAAKQQEEVERLGERLCAPLQAARLAVCTVAWEAGAPGTHTTSKVSRAPGHGGCQAQHRMCGAWQLRHGGQRGQGMQVQGTVVSCAV